MTMKCLKCTLAMIIEPATTEKTSKPVIMLHVHDAEVIEYHFISSLTTAQVYDVGKIGKYTSEVSVLSEMQLGLLMERE
jgi:hypothetical protein